MTTRIIEIIDRSTQGVTHPFLCRGDDGWLYYVKGNAAGRSSLICEWIAGQLGKRLGLPIPEFKQAIIPKELVTFSARDDIADLGAGTGFASQKIENADELSYLFIEQIDTTLRAKILLFDCGPPTETAPSPRTEATPIFFGSIATRNPTSSTTTTPSTKLRSPIFGHSTSLPPRAPRGRTPFGTTPNAL